MSDNVGWSHWRNGQPMQQDHFDKAMQLLWDYRAMHDKKDKAARLRGLRRGIRSKHP